MENPKIRFKGFTKDWEQRNVSEITKFHKQGFYTTEEYDNSKKYYLLRGTDLTENKLVLKDTPKIDATEKDYDAFKTEIGDFLIVRSGTVGTYGIVDVDIPAIFGSYLIDFRFDMEQVTNEFFGYFYQSSLFKSQLNKIIQASANTNINAENIKSTVISLPSLNEQRRISEYLGNLDNLITLHQRKCEQTKKLKKYMLQKMFPQNGAKVPEIRFYGFTYDWEQRKLGDVFEQTSNLVNPKEDEIELWSLTVEDGLTKKSDRYNREFLVKKDDNFKEVRPGDIVYNPMNMTLGAVGYNGMAKSVAVSGYYTTMVAKENYDTYYINTWLKSPQAIRLYRTYATGSLIEKQRVQFPTLSIIPVTFPKYEEQIKIGSYFHSIDNLITLHQRKCDELKKMKKYMLQNMFI